MNLVKDASVYCLYAPDLDAAPELAAEASEYLAENGCKYTVNGRCAVVDFLIEKTTEGANNDG